MKSNNQNSQSVNQNNKINSNLHEHLLSFLTNIEKGYSENGWICDICKEGKDSSVSSLHCGICKFDVCDKCFKKDFPYKE